MRLAGQQAGNRAVEACQAANERATRRRADYDRRLTSLGEEQQHMLREFRETYPAEGSPRRVPAEEYTMLDRPTRTTAARNLESTSATSRKSLTIGSFRLLQTVQLQFSSQHRRVDGELRRHAAEFDRALEHQRRESPAPDGATDIAAWKMSGRQRSTGMRQPMPKLNCVRGHFRHDLLRRTRD